MSAKSSYERLKTIHEAFRVEIYIKIYIGYTVYTYLFFKNMARSFAPKQRLQFEIFRKGDGLSLVHLLGIKAVSPLR